MIFTGSNKLPLKVLSGKTIPSSYKNLRRTFSNLCWQLELFPAHSFFWRSDDAGQIEEFPAVILKPLPAVRTIPGT
jgi:hypothetical protein